MTGGGFGLDQLPLFERGPRAGWIIGAACLLAGGLLLGAGFLAGGAALLLVVPAAPVVGVGLYAVAVASSHVIVSRDRLTVRNLLHQVDVSVTGVRSIEWGPLPWTGPLAALPAAAGLARAGLTATFVDDRRVPLLATTVVRRAGAGDAAAGSTSGETDPARARADRIVTAWRFARSLHR